MLWITFEQALPADGESLYFLAFPPLCTLNAQLKKRYIFQLVRNLIKNISPEWLINFKIITSTKQDNIGTVVAMLTLSKELISPNEAGAFCKGQEL